MFSILGFFRNIKGLIAGGLYVDSGLKSQISETLANNIRFQLFRPFSLVKKKE
jgi:hypothetical protein